MTFRHPQSPEVPDRRRPRRCRTRPHPVSRRETFPRAVGLARRGSRPWRFCAGCAASPRGITTGRRSIRTPCCTAKRAKGRKVSGDVAGQRTRRFFFSEAGFEKRFRTKDLIRSAFGSEKMTGQSSSQRRDPDLGAVFQRRVDLRARGVSPSAVRGVIEETAFLTLRVLLRASSQGRGTLVAGHHGPIDLSAS